MKKPTVFILFDHLLFARGLEGLLRKRGEVEVVGVVPKGEEALGMIAAAKPDAVFLEAGKEGPQVGALLSRLLQQQHEVRVVCVSLWDGSSTLYAGRQWAANEVDDLIEGIFDPMVVA